MSSISLMITTEAQLAAVAGALAGTLRFSAEERKLIKAGYPASEDLVAAARAAIVAGGDPLGDALGRIRSPEKRRGKGQTFTPPEIVADMVARAAADAAANGAFSRIVDPGLGSGRYLRAAAAAFPDAELIGVEIDPLCALIARATLHVAGLTPRLRIILEDFRKAKLRKIKGRTLFIGNPPYVRHHDIGEPWKDWYAVQAMAQGARTASKLAGLHLHFFVRVGQLASDGDFGLLITAAEWMDTSYGDTLRSLLSGSLGGTDVITIDAKAEPFPGTMTTAAITSFAPGRDVTAMRFGEAISVGGLPCTLLREIPADDLASSKWTRFLHAPVAPTALSAQRRHKLGDLFQVSRGQVTGKNEVFVLSPDAPPVPKKFLTPCVTGASELFEAADRHDFRLSKAIKLQMVVNMPCELSAKDRTAATAWLRWAEANGARDSYTAKHRKCWWHISLHEPPPIIVTYMARRTPVFVRNDVGARLLNIAHGVRPRVAMTSQQLDAACKAMNEAVALRGGRTYAGGLVKFEPRDVEAIEIDLDTIGLAGLLTTWREAAE